MQQIAGLGVTYSKWGCNRHLARPCHAAHECAIFLYFIILISQRKPLPLQQKIIQHNMTGNKIPLFQRPLFVTLFALTAAIVWGWAYPLIKLGMAEYGIGADMTGSKMLFAGIRFMLSGLIILAVAWRTHRSFSIRFTLDW